MRGAAVSAGNTGALMAMTKLSLRTMPGIDRPALAGLMPTLDENDVVMLDLGANTECDARNLVQFAVMGAAYARIALELETPARRAAQHRHRGPKGTESIRDAAQRARARDASAADLRRLHRGRQADARRCRCDRLRRLFRQYRAQDDRGHGALRHRPAASAPSAARCARRSASSSRARRPSCCATISTPTTTMARCSSGSTGWS